MASPATASGPSTSSPMTTRRPQADARCFTARLGSMAAGHMRMAAKKERPMSADAPQRVVVVGAGLAGLCVGALFAKAGHAPSVLEAHRPPVGQGGDPLASVNLAPSAPRLRSL